MNKNISVIGSGITGSTISRVFANEDVKVHVFESLPVVGGAIRDHMHFGINVHRYGPHIFHTNSEDVWGWVNQYSEWYDYDHKVVAMTEDNELVPLPFTLNTFSKLWDDVNDEESAREKIYQETKFYKELEPKNLKEVALKTVGKTIYEKLIRDYSEKQWGRKCEKIPSSFIKRLPIKFDWSDNYFDDKYQVMPKNGYSTFIKNMLNHENITITDDRQIDLSDMRLLADIYDYIFFTGAIDELYDYCYGYLDYRSNQWVNTIHEDTSNYQDKAVINYTGKNQEYTRKIEWKHFMENCENKTSTIVSDEYPDEWKIGKERHYPIGDVKNKKLYKKYLDKLNNDFGQKVIPVGRLAEYKYYNMDTCVERGINISKRVISLLKK